MVKHIANINNNILTFDINGTFGAPGIKTSVIEHTTNGTGSAGEVITSDGNGGWSWSQPSSQSIAATDGGPLIFYTKENGGNVTEKMRITDAGNVGIGTSSPSYKLEVNGDIKVNNLIFGTGQRLELFTNTTSINSYGFFEMRDTITSIGCPKFRVLTNSSAGGIGAERFTILANGNVGIGNNNPTHTLEVNGSIDCDNITVNDKIYGTGNNIDIYPNTNANNSVSFLELRTTRMALGGPVLEFYPGSTSSTAGSAKMKLYNDRYEFGFRDFGYLNNVAISVDARDIGGTDCVGYCTDTDGNWILVFYNSARSGSKGKIRGVSSTQVAYDTTSDRRLKENITPMPSMLEKIKQLEPVYYTWKEDGKKGDGFIAQEVHKVFPQLRDFNVWDRCKCGMTFNDAWDGKTCECEECDVENPKNTVGNDYTFGLDYGRFTPYIIKAMQEQQEIIERQETLIQSLVSRIEALENK